jgi:predicted RNA-binding Zn-ribbon protein involved in translation (DUF1610 family)
MKRKPPVFVPCPRCGKTKVKPAPGGWKRLARRPAVCVACGHKFSTRQLSLFAPGLA